MPLPSDHAQVAAVGAFLRRACGCDHACTDAARSLDGEGADAARSALYQERFPCSQRLCVEEQVGPHGKGCLRQRRGVFHRDAFRNRQHLSLRGHAVFRISSARQQRTHRVANLPSRHIRACCGDVSAHLHPQDVGDTGRRRVMSLALHDVGAVHAGGCHLDEHFVRPGRRAREFSNAHRSGFAWPLDHDRPHALFSDIHTVSLKHFSCRCAAANES
jgi:hypothetical protein